MRIAFDCDGVLTEGKFISPPRSKLDYMELAPYDQDTAKYAQRIFEEHDCYIITARSEERATATIVEWLNQVLGIKYCYVGIITNPYPNSTSEEAAIWKYELCKQLGCDMVFDDNPELYDYYLHTVEPGQPQAFLVNNPVWSKNQEYNQCKRLCAWKEIFETINNRSTY